MRISGGATMHAPAGRVWAALTDPAVLVAAIPGCEQFEPAGPDTYRFTVAAAVASIQASYTGEVSLSQQQQPSSFVLTASGAGAPGTVTTSVQIRLADIADGTTELSYDADAVIGGLIAGVGQRMLSSVARRLAGAFFNSVDEALVGTGPAGPVLADAFPAGTAAASTVPAGRVLTDTAPVGAAAASAVPDGRVLADTIPADRALTSTRPGSPAAEPGPVPGPTAPQPTGPVPPEPNFTRSSSAGQPAQAGPDPAPALRGGSARSSLGAGFTRGMLAGVAVTLAGVAAAGLIRRRAR
jgi:carbon monoxide dehydrogenase subunit G